MGRDDQDFTIQAYLINLKIRTELCNYELWPGSRLLNGVAQSIGYHIHTEIFNRYLSYKVSSPYLR